MDRDVALDSDYGHGKSFAEDIFGATGAHQSLTLALVHLPEWYARLVISPCHTSSRPKLIADDWSK